LCSSAGSGFRRCDRERGQGRLSTVPPIVPARPARVQGPGGQAQAPPSYATSGLAVGLGNTQPRGIIAALDAGMNWARRKSLFDLAMNRMETLLQSPPELLNLRFQLEEPTSRRMRCLLM
jgi:hypothetical protein